jgi:hypothetical protein
LLETEFQVKTIPMILGFQDVREAASPGKRLPI